MPGTASAASSPSKAKGKAVGRVYTETNSPNQNRVLIFDRFANGHLKLVGSVATGGQGGQQLQPGCAPTCPFLDTQGELAQTSDGKHVFAVNAGSNSVSSFRWTPAGLKLVSVQSSGGKFPNSLTIHGNLLYVLDSGIFPMPGPPVPGNIAGLRFNAAGHLNPISGSIQPLTPTVPGLARQVGFNNNGKLLVVSLLGDPTLPTPVATDSIDTFNVSASGAASAATPHNATTPFPFGFAFRPQGPPDHVAGHEPHGSGSRRRGQLQRGRLGCADSDRDRPHQGDRSVLGRKRSPRTESTRSSSTPAGALTGAFTSEFRVFPNGGLKLLGNTAVRKNEFALTDETLSSDSRYLYVLSTGASPATHHIDEYKVGANGILTLIGQTPAMAVPGASGLVGS